MTIRFSIDHWAAWAPGLLDQAAWRAWLRNPGPVESGDVPALAEMPAMMRRRVERLGRVALQSAYWVQGEQAPSSVIFASRQGDIGRSLQLLRQLASGESMSPTSFSMSVHNAISALYSIANAQTCPYTAIAAGAETVEAAFVEALGQLADGTPDVLLVCYDEPLPPPYAVFDAGIAFARSFAFRLSLAKTGGFGLRSGPSAQPVAPSATGAALPADLAVLDFLVHGDAPQLLRTVGARQWEWSRHGALV